MNKQKPRFFCKEFRPEKWHAFDRESSETVPMYDDAPYGKNKPLVFKDEDSVMEFVKTMNSAKL